MHTLYEEVSKNHMTYNFYEHKTTSAPSPGYVAEVVCKCCVEIKYNLLCKAPFIYSAVHDLIYVLTYLTMNELYKQT